MSPYKRALFWFELCFLLRNILSSPANEIHPRDINNEFLFRSPYNAEIVTGFDVKKFKAKNKIRSDANLPIQAITPENTLRVAERTLNLDHATPMNIFSPSATYMNDDNIISELPTTQDLLHMENDKEHVLVIKDLHEKRISLVFIKNKATGKSIQLEGISDGIFLTIQEEDYELSPKIRYDDMGIEANAHDVHSRNVVNSTGLPRLEYLWQVFRFCVFRIGRGINVLNSMFHSNVLNNCQSYRQLKIAIAYDASFCAQHENKFRADVAAKAIVALASLKYKQLPLCVDIKLSHLEGYCHNETDPYNKMIGKKLSGCSEQNGLVYDFFDYWDINRTNVTRDAVHLLTGTDMECNDDGCVVGCAYLAVTCGNFAYGVDDMSFSTSLNRRANLFAHEFGHNNGALHMNPPSNDSSYLMDLQSNSGTDGFSQQSMMDMVGYLEFENCGTRVTRRFDTILEWLKCLLPNRTQSQDVIDEEKIESQSIHFLRSRPP